MVYKLVVSLLLICSKPLHEFYVSITNISCTDDQLLATTRIFYDDLENHFLSTGFAEWDPQVDSVAKRALEDYLCHTIGFGPDQDCGDLFSVELEGYGDTKTVVARFTYSLPNVSEHIRVYNAVLTAGLSEQINMIHFKGKTGRSSKNLDRYQTSVRFNL